MSRLNQMADEGEWALAHHLLLQWDEGHISMPDCSYTVEPHIEIAFEVVTSHYGPDELEAKERAVEVLSLEYETERI